VNSDDSASIGPSAKSPSTDGLLGTDEMQSEHRLQELLPELSKYQHEVILRSDAARNPDDLRLFLK
jgi:hypothetical protein